jgi:hypothetical protein
MLATNFVSCKREKINPDNPEKNNEEELITTVKLTMTDASNISDIRTAIFKDPDGYGGNSYTQFDTIKLSANKIYNVSVELFDDTKTPPADITTEIKREADSHQFFYTVTGGVSLSVSYVDSDKDRYGVPLGISPIFTTGGVSSGYLTVTLKHQSFNKPRSGNGNISIGATDVEVTFRVLIQ